MVAFCMTRFLQEQALCKGFDYDTISCFESVYLNGQRVNFESAHAQTLGSEDLIKVFPQPKRFSMQHLSRENILFEDQDLLVIDKPAGVPCLPVASNSKENCKYYFESKIGQGLYPIHRLDEMTCGVLLFAKNSATVKKFQMDQAIGKVRKIYMTLTSAPLQPGVYESFIAKGQGRMLVFDGPVPSGKPCALRVLNQDRFGDHFVTSLELITGRTHQIRAQLSHLRAPLVGDSLYGSGATKNDDFFLCADSLKWRSHKFESRFTSNHTF
jgi:23S rRNA pseudouridine1911/1915/1917 synthase